MQAVMFPVALLSLKCDVKAEFVNTESTAKVLLNFLSVICASVVSLFTVLCHLKIVSILLFCDMTISKS